ncbi:hypothetical protein HK101_001425 [Irineochytrium annulatum]|nr:hypothetical protein HK101_001425 [Irineochytrium annulatum]
MSSSPERLISFIPAFPAGSEPLVLKIIQVLTMDNACPEGLAPKVLNIVKERNLDGTFLLPVISYMDKASVMLNLDKILMLLVVPSGNEEQKGAIEEKKAVVEETFLKVLDIPAPTATVNGVGASTKSREGPKIDPSEFLVAIHNLEEKVGVQRVLEATQICFKHVDIFKSEVLAVVMQQLLDQTTTPLLFMRTVLSSVKEFPSLTGYVVNVLTRLVQKKVWTIPILWEGFIRCCSRTAPTSFPVLVSLPKQQLEEVLRKVPALKQQLLEHVTSLPPQMRSRLKAVLSILSSGGEKKDAAIHDFEREREREKMERRSVAAK